MCESNRSKFDPQKTEQKGQKAPKFDLDSVEAQMIADSVESGLSIARTLGFLNEHLVGEGWEASTMSSIISVVQRLRSMIKKVDKQKQGSSDPNSDWARVRFLFTKQLMILLGLLNDTSP